MEEYRSAYQEFASAVLEGVPAVFHNLEYADLATSQVAASSILTAILVPIIVSWWAKKFGCPQFPKDEAQRALFEKQA